MNTLRRFFRSKPIRFIIIATSVAIMAVLVVSIVLATYTSFRSSTREAVNVQTRELSAQIVYNYENYIGSIIETSNIIQTDMGRYNLEEGQDAAAFAGYLEEIVHLKSDIIKIAVYGYDTGRCLVSSNTEERGLLYDYEGDDSSWFYEAIADPTVHVFSVPYAATDGDYKVNLQAD